VVKDTAVKDMAVKKTAVKQAARGTSHKSSPRKVHKTSMNDFPIVAIGASAGGLDAIEKFFTHTPSDSGAAYVIIQHLQPKYKSLMPELLTKYTKMMVHEIKDGMAMEPDHIYLNPPDKEVDLIGRVFRLSEPVIVHGIRLPVDHFFRSLSVDAGERAVCVILSGTGSDGTKGLEEVKASGGMALAQDEQQASFSDMPRNAIRTGFVDFVLPVEMMSAEILRAMKHPYFISALKETPADKRFQGFVYKILAAVKSMTGHDFSHYKQNTTRRRIERRMAIHRIDEIGAYHSLLNDNRDEVFLLFKDLLIGVTSFFRDPAAFEALKEKIIGPLLSARKSGSSIRIWVPGCSTGEEAFSMAMLFIEVMEEMKETFELQIFATDIDAASIERARTGQYPVSISQDVSPERLSRFFIKGEESFKIRREIREMVVFAVQNVISDPPFSRLDFISCRNLLIYLDLELQKKIFPLFSYVLVDGGYLFLGSSETIGQFSDIFSQVDIKNKIFQKKETMGPRIADYPPLTFSDNIALARNGRIKKGEAAFNAQELMDSLILQDYAPPSLLINNKFDILFFRGATDRYLSFPAGAPSFNILNVAREGLRHRLSASLHRARKERKISVSRGVQIEREGEILSFDLIIRPLSESEQARDLFIVIFEEKWPPEPLAKKSGRVKTEDCDTRVASLEQELLLTREYLQTTVEELETSNEELKSTNEELQSTNEEMQSANEELETAKEELQSTNEELMTVNSELQTKLDELTQANNDINNLLASTEIGTIFLDAELNIKRFTPSISKVFNFISSDIGRSLKDITPKITYEGIYGDAESVLATLQTIEREVMTKDGKWFTMRILPYRTRTNLIDGLVLTFVDSTTRKLAEAALKESRSFVESVIEAFDEPLLVIDSSLIIRAANRAFLAHFNIKRGEALNRHFYEISDRSLDMPGLREALDGIMKTGIPPEGIDLEQKQVGTVGLKMRINAWKLLSPWGNGDLVLLIFNETVKK
jgi:two-component system, chemotaxis family, CheB/CheR fusion protein